jgi:hypothetical protein
VQQQLLESAVWQAAAAGSARIDAVLNIDWRSRIRLQDVQHATQTMQRTYCTIAGCCLPAISYNNSIVVLTAKFRGYCISTHIA